MPTNTTIFQDRASGVTIRVESVNKGYAQIEVMTRLPSRFSMPIAQYDGDEERMLPGQVSFVKKYRPVKMGDVPIDAPGFRLPANAHLWDEEDASPPTPEVTEAVAAADETTEAKKTPEPGTADERGEGDEGVTVGTEY